MGREDLHGAQRMTLLLMKVESDDERDSQRAPRDRC
jgi:hypothetical protein